jgi:hypothetical protein
MSSLPHDFNASKKRKHFTEQEDHLIKSTVAEKGGKFWKELGFI